MKSFRIHHAFLLCLLFLGWLIFLCDQEMARYGIYTLFPYSVHEFLSALPLIFIAATAVWLLITPVSSIRRKAFAQNILLLAFLANCLFAQSYMLAARSHKVSVTGIATIRSIHPQALEAVAVKQDGSTITLEIPVLLSEMLRTDGSEYLISYEYDSRNPSHGVLCMAQDTNH